jgi:hypothetical protein
VQGRSDGDRRFSLETKASEKNRVIY